MIALTLASLTNVGVSGEQLDLLTRFGRQLAADNGDGSPSGGSGGGITLGLVGALQKWANTLEAQTATIIAEVDDLKAAKASLTAEMSEVKLQNINLSNDIQSANDRTLNLKEAYTRSKDEVASLKAEVAGLRSTLESQAAQLGQQAATMAATEELMAGHSSQLAGVTDELAGLQGKHDEFQAEAVAALTASAEALHSNLTSTLHDLSLALDASKEDTGSSLAALGTQLVDLEERQALEAANWRAEVGNASSTLDTKMAALNSQVQRELTGSLQGRVGRGNVTTLLLLLLVGYLFDLNYCVKFFGNLVKNTEITIAIKKLPAFTFKNARTGITLSLFFFHLFWTSQENRNHLP